MLPPNMQAFDYAFIDDDLSTEESRDDITHFVASHSSVTEDSTDEEEWDKEDESLVTAPSTVNDFPSAL